MSSWVITKIAAGLRHASCGSFDAVVTSIFPSASRPTFERLALRRVRGLDVGADRTRPPRRECEQKRGHAHVQTPPLDDRSGIGWSPMSLWMNPQAGRQAAGHGAPEERGPSAGADGRGPRTMSVSVRDAGL